MTTGSASQQARHQAIGQLHSHRRVPLDHQDIQERNVETKVRDDAPASCVPGGVSRRPAVRAGALGPDSPIGGTPSTAAASTYSSWRRRRHLFGRRPKRKRPVFASANTGRFEE